MLMMPKPNRPRPASSRQLEEIKQSSTHSSESSKPAGYAVEETKEAPAPAEQRHPRDAATQAARRASRASGAVPSSSQGNLYGAMDEQRGGSRPLRSPAASSQAVDVPGQSRDRPIKAPLHEACSALSSDEAEPQSCFIPHYRIQEGARNAFWNYRFVRAEGGEQPTAPSRLRCLLDGFDTDLTFSG